LPAREEILVVYFPHYNTGFDVIYQQNNGQPIVLSFPAQGHQQFKLGAGVAVGTFPNPVSLIESGGHFPGRAASAIPFIVKAGGLITAGRGVQVQIDVNQGTGLTPSIASTGSFTTPLGAGLYQDNWVIEIEGMWDPTSLNLRGIQYGWIGGTQISQAALVGSAPANLAALQFNVAATVVNANASNSFTLTEFSGDLV